MARPTSVLLAHKSSNPTHIPKCLPRMSWSPANLYNLYQRTYGPPTVDTKFTKSSLTLFQQKWKAKQLARGYHGDWINEQKFKKHFLPDSLPPIIGSKANPAKRRGGAGAGPSGASQMTEESDKVPLASLMFAEIEKRLDTVVFRCCFADSVYRARQMVVHGKVTVNGLKATDPNLTLHPGDLISVEPSAVTTLQPIKPQDGGPKRSTAPTENVDATSSTPAPPTESAEAATDSSTDASTPPASKLPPAPSTGPKPLPFHLPDYAAPFLFVPPYLEVSWTTCSAVYLRHPTAGPGHSEVPSPYDADGEVMKLTWEYYAALGRKGDKRPSKLVGKRLGA